MGGLASWPAEELQASRPELEVLGEGTRHSTNISPSPWQSLLPSASHWWLEALLAAAVPVMLCSIATDGPALQKPTNVFSELAFISDYHRTAEKVSACVGYSVVLL